MGKIFTPESISSGFNTNSTLNTNFTNIETALDKCLSRDGESPNAMNADIDLNSNDLLNVNVGNFSQILIDGAEIPSLDSITTTYADTVAAKDEAEHWANYPVSTLVPEGDLVDDYSALHWADKSNKWAETAFNTEVETGQYSSLHWAEKAHKWAEEAEDTEVETGEYSAHHWANKAASSASSVNLPTSPESFDDQKILVYDRASLGYVYQERGIQTSGTNTLTADAGWQSYHPRVPIVVDVTGTNTGPVTINLDSLGARDVLMPNGDPLPAGALVSDNKYLFIYNTNDFTVINPSVSQTTAEAGTQEDGVMTPLRTQQLYDAQYETAPTNYVESKQVFLYAGTNGSSRYNTTGFDVTGTLTKNTTTSIGATGEGAAQTWTALDDLPANTKGVYLSIDTSLTYDGSLTPYLQLSLDGTTSTRVIDTTPLLLAGSAATYENAHFYPTVYVPIFTQSGNQRQILLNWDSNNLSAQSIDIYLEGFVV